MRLEYYSDTDTLYIQLRDEPGADAQEVADDVVLDLNAADDVVGIEIEHASQRIDLRDFHLSSIPTTSAAPSAS
jgi:uncharacterized protein YuzE